MTAPRSDPSMSFEALALSDHFLIDFYEIEDLQRVVTQARRRILQYGDEGQERSRRNP